MLTYFMSNLLFRKTEYSQGWLHRFKLRHGISQCRMSDERKSAEGAAASAYVDEFVNLVASENLSLEQIYNADETALY